MKKIIAGVLAMMNISMMSLPASALEFSVLESRILEQGKDVISMFKESGWDKCVVYSDETIAVSSYYVPSTSETIVVVPDDFFWTFGTVTQIGYDSEPAIRNADAVTAVVIPDTIQIIGDNAFSACPNLKDVYYIGTEDQWNTIAIGSGNDNLLNAEIHCGFTEEDLSPFMYSVLDDGGIEITKYIQYFPNGDVDIPSEIDGYPVTSIGSSAFAYCYDLTSVTIPDSVTSIGDRAFSYCYDLTSVTIPNSVTNIGEGAFSNTDLTSITIPDSVTSIEDYTFFYCTNLTSVTIPDNVTNIGEGAFSDCTGLTSVTIPNSVTNIGNNAFSGCTGLTSITIPDSVTDISRAFSGCSSLLSIDVSENSSIYSSENGVLFSKDKTELLRCPVGISGTYTIPDNVTSIKSSAFSGCTSLTSVTIPDSITSIEEFAFSDCTGLTSVTIPDSVTSIEDSTFSRCTGLTSITIPDSVTSIEDSTFSRCTGLTSITIPDSVTSIGMWAFSDCTDLTSIIIPDSVTIIGDSAFSDCTGLTSVTIPDSVTSIGMSAFSRCTGLTSITIPDSVTEIRGGTFEGCTGLISIDVDKNNLAYVSENGVLFNKDKTELLQYPAGISGAYTIPDGVTYIGSSSFSGCTALTSVTIPNSVTYIASYAFYLCDGLTSIAIKNPDCEISNGNGNYDCTIYGYENSTAQAYAEENGYKFEVLGEVSDSTTVPTNPEITLWGDVNLDKDINISDAVLIMQSIANPDEFNIEKQGKLNGDVVDNGNGLTNVDALAIQYVEIKTITPDAFPMTSTELDTLSE